MAVYRVNKTKGFTVMANYHLQDITISLKAVGLLTKMLSFPDGWKFSTEGLAAICKEGPDAIQSALKELEQHGYLARHRLRDEKGRMTCTAFEIYEKPQAVAPHEENPHKENPDVDNPPVENPRRENPGQSNTYKTNTKKSNTDSINHPSKGDRADEMSRSDLEEEIKTNIDYDIIVENKQNDKRQIDEIVTLMLDAIENGIMENSRISAYEAAEKVWLDNGLSNIMIADREELLQKVQEVENGGKNLDEMEQEPPTIPPVYVETGTYARDHGELDAYRESAKLNRECAHAISEYISDNYRDNKLDDSGIKDVIGKFGADRVQIVLANTVQQADWDGRYSRDNKAWANTFPALPDNVFERVTGHPCLVDGLTDMVRRKLREAERTTEKPSIREQLKTIAKELEPKKQPAKNKEQGVEL